MKNNFFGTNNLVVIGEAGFCFAEYVLSKSLIKSKFTSILKKDKHKPIGKEVLSHNVFWSQSNFNLDFLQIGKLQANNKSSLIVFSSASEFSSNVALKLNTVLSQLSVSTSYVVIGPFRFEGTKRQKLADDTYEKLVASGSSCFRFSNQDIFKLINPESSFDYGFGKLNAEILKFLGTTR